MEPPEHRSTLSVSPSLESSGFGFLFGLPGSVSLSALPLDESGPPYKAKKNSMEYIIGSSSLLRNEQNHRKVCYLAGYGPDCFKSSYYLVLHQYHLDPI